MEVVQSTLKKPLQEAENNSSVQNIKEQGANSPVKQTVSTTAPVDVDSKSSSSKEALAEQEDEQDVLSLRLEALEKGEDPDAITIETKKESEAKHQNGLTEKSTAEAEVTKPKDNVKKEPVASESGEKSQATVKSAEVGTVPKKTLADEHTPATSKEETTAAVETAEAVSSNAKRKHSDNEPETSVEPHVKKIHVGDVPDSVEPSTEKMKTLENLSSAPDVESNASVVEKVQSKVSQMEVSVENPSSVEKMDVDLSPESQTSPDNLETLPDTEPNTEPDDKVEEISSSVAEEPSHSDSTTENVAGKSENSNVSSSDDKRSGTNEKRKLPDSEVSASVVPGPSADEAMDVDEDEVDRAESSTSPEVDTGSVAMVPVKEPPCVKKVAYLCTDDDKPDETQKGKHTPVASPSKPAVVASTSATESPTPGSTLNAAKEKVVKKLVESPTKANSSVLVETAVSLSEAQAAVDSSKKPTSENPASASSAGASASTMKEELVDDSVVESSQPSSSSDSTKKQLSDHRLNEQLREAVHRSGLVAKTSSTPNSNATLATSSPQTPKTLNPVTTSAVSSSNVYSSTPIHPNFVKVSSGNVSKITNPPSSVETSQIEADETTTTTTTTTTDQSSSVVASSEEKETCSSRTTATESTTKNSLTVTPTKGEKTLTTDSATSKSSPPKKDLLKREESSSSSSSSLKTTDSSEVDSCTVASAMNTAEEINMYTTNARKFNGISSTSEGSELEIKTDALKVRIAKLGEDSKVNLVSTEAQLDLSCAISPSTPAEQLYEVSVWYEGKDLQFLSVERIHSGKEESTSLFDPSTTTGTTAATQDGSSIIDSSSKQSSSSTNGSVSSLGPFALPQNRPSLADAATQSSNSSTVSVGPAPVQQSVAKSTTSTLSVPQVKQTVSGPRALCDLLIEEFKKLRRTLSPDVRDEDEESCQQIDDQLLHTPKTSGSARGQRGGSSTSKKGVAARGQKRSKAVDSDEDDDAESEQRTPRSSGTSATKHSAKKAKPSHSPTVTSTATLKSKSTEEQKFDLCCLARWTDRKYYAGRVTNFRGDNKYVVVFEDGCSKTLSRDIIVFGEDGVLPILNHSIHALTGGDTYEPAIVEEIKRTGDSSEVVYAVRTATSKLEVTATDIYLTDEQAKWIHNSLKGKPDPMEALLQSAVVGSQSTSIASDGPAVEGESASEQASESAASDKGARATRSTRSGAPLTPEAGFSGGVGKKGRRGRRLS